MTSLSFPDVSVWLAVMLADHAHRARWESFSRYAQIGVLRPLTTAAAMSVLLVRYGLSNSLVGWRLRVAGSISGGCEQRHTARGSLGSRPIHAFELGASCASECECRKGHLSRALNAQCRKWPFAVLPRDRTRQHHRLAGDSGPRRLSARRRGARRIRSCALWLYGARRGW